MVPRCDAAARGIAVFLGSDGLADCFPPTPRTVDKSSQVHMPILPTRYSCMPCAPARTTAELYR